MLFGWSFPKLMIVLSIGFLLFGVPTLAYIVAKVRRRREARTVAARPR